MALINGLLWCDMNRDCADSVLMIDNKGFGYCSQHGLRRRASGVPCRKLRPSEIKQLKRGESVKKY